jgi:hypothetical protein
MEFPRLTSGGSGRLTFDVVNDMFERIEALEGKGIPRKLHKDYASDIFPAQITTENPAKPGEYQFTEQSRFPATGIFVSINGRRSSGYLQGIFTNYATPAIAQAGLPSGSILYLLGRDNQDGKLEYLSVSSPAQSGGGTVALIQSATPITTNLRWKYSVIEAQYLDMSNIFIPLVGATSFFAWNGAENTTDSTSKGVGFVPSSNAAAIYTRQPIKNGIAVEIIKDKNRLAMFSIPNGYKVVC